MPAHYALVGGLKPPKRIRVAKMSYNAILGNFWGSFLLNCGRYARFLLFLMFLYHYFLYSFCRFWSKFHAPRMALADDNVGQKEFFITFILYIISLIPSLGQMAFNVPAVTEVWAGI